jgi:hypothetical protein
MENCKGCHTYNHLTISCSASIINNSDKCPCRICLIKTVCNKACGEYRIFSGQYSRPEHIKETT